MPQYIRAKEPGGTFFFTVVTHRRRKLFNDPENRLSLRKVIMEVQSSHPFIIDAWVLLPEHLHCLWTLPEGDTDFSKRWGLIKAKFSGEQKTKGSPLWQERFWEHLIRNDQDFQRHVDYIHYNPVKHSLVENPRDWPFSTFHRYVKEGFYPVNWGEGVSFNSDDRFGE
ncbi:MAG: transposase [Deltaproteobacteria bacterium RBG_13_58_19]|nr:MAG: transposase [Deltaproteobacteria bacterium RBG_13_58_19]